MTYDRTLKICTAGNRDALFWAPEEIRWSALAERLKTPRKGTETHTAYMRMAKAQQDRLKDVGGFLGGTLKNGRRQIRGVTGRDLVTLDLDAIPARGADAVLFDVDLLGCAACIYSTRKHDAEHPRLRVILPLKRTVSAEEYEPAARRIAQKLGIEKCDPTCFRPNQMMYWPNVSSDSEYVYEVYDKPLLDPDAVLGEYADWRDMRSWPQVPGHEADAKRAAEKAEDPTGKTGIVGAFCRAYDVRRVMDELIPGTYEPTADPERYTYAHGSTAGGAIVYEDKWLYSHHATDPAGGRLCNAWDLARIHLYGEKDEGAAPETPVGKLPSYTAMSAMALGIPEVKRILLDEKRARLLEDFGPSDGEWRLALETDSKGTVKGTLVNLKMIFENDTALSPIGRDAFQQRNLVTGDLPWSKDGDPGAYPRDWTDDDDNGAAWYIEAAYGVKDLRRIKMAADLAMAARETDTLREYVQGLVWDGVPRVDALLVRYLRADDTPYVRAVTRKTLAAAVARAMEPGCKFDSVLTLIGAQGIAKSLFAGILGGRWYNDSLQTFVGKEAAEQLRGTWIVEIPEVDRFSAKYEAAAVKQFITRQDDIYREAYGRRTAPHPRRCVFIATTNEPNFLVDASGNRRWWIVHCRATAQEPGEDMAELRRDRDQVWAEAAELWRRGEKLTLERELYADALEAQEGAQVEDPWLGMIQAFAERHVPKDWDVWKPDDRRTWWHDEFGQSRQEDALAERKRICVTEVWYELFERDRGSLDGRASRRIANALRSLPGWEEVGPRPTVYGSQKCFARTEMLPPGAARKAPEGAQRRERGGEITGDPKLPSHYQNYQN